MASPPTAKRRLLSIVPVCGALLAPSRSSARAPNRRNAHVWRRAAPDADDLLDSLWDALEPAVEPAADFDDADDGGGGDWSAGSSWDDGGGPNFVDDGNDWQSLDDATEEALGLLSRPRSSFEADEPARPDDADEAVDPPRIDADEAVDPLRIDVDEAVDLLQAPHAPPSPAFEHPAFDEGQAVEVLCEDDGYWYEATLRHVGLVICVAYYDAYDESETVEIARIRPRTEAATALLDDVLEPEAEATPDYGEVDSHTLIKNRDDFEGYSYVDEQACVGCYNCAVIAPATFFMEDDHGSARVFHQHGDADETIAEAIDTCPVNCIHTVSYDELERLEVERRDQRINFMGRLMARAQGTSMTTASMTMTSTGRASKPQRVAVTEEDDAFRARAAEKDRGRKDRARRDLEKTSGIRTGTVEL